MGEGWATWLDNPLVQVYLLGCLLAAVLIVVRIVFFSLLNWITKENILNRNLKKLMPPDQRAFSTKAAEQLFYLVFAVALSWINVLYILWDIARALLGEVRRLFSSTPEAVKLLKFPLWNNPGMPRESVWAHIQALQIRGGEKEPNEKDLRSGLDQLLEYYPRFDRAAALRKLQALKVMPADVVSATLDNLSKPPQDQIDGPW